MLEAKLAQNNLNFKCSFMFFLVRARFGPKTGGGGEFRPPLMKNVGKMLNETRVKNNKQYMKM